MCFTRVQGDRYAYSLGSTNLGNIASRSRPATCSPAYSLGSTNLRNGRDRPAKPTSHRGGCPTDMGLDIQFSATPLAPEALSPDCYPPMVADGIHDEREPAEESTMPRALGTRQFPISLLIGTPLACSPHALDVRETSLRGGCPMNRRSSWAQSQKEEAANFHVGSQGQL